MTGFIISATVEVVVITALILTIKKRKKIELSIFLFLIAFEVFVMLVSGWAFIIYGTIIEMGNI